MLLGAPAASPAQDHGAAALATALELLRHEVPRVLYIAAHPDDEDTRLITWLARGGYAEVAYLSLNRGEGGQNVIGDELGDALGVLRTQELLTARRIDGGSQFFTRAYDFGYSKTAEETYGHWPRDSLLNDMVRIVRAFRPHVLVSTFSGTPRDAHGQHQVAGLLTRDVYDVADDTVRFPAREFGAPWLPLKLYRLAAFAAGEPTIAIDVGEYDPLIGRSYAEIASDSRSSHKSQGYGPNARLGEVLGRYRREATRVNEEVPAEQERSILDGVPGARARGTPALAAGGSFSGSAHVDLRRPETAIPLIATFSPRDEQERRRHDRAAVLATGLALEALSARPFVAVGDTVSVTYSLYNRGGVAVRLDSAAGAFPREWIAPGQAATWTTVLRPAEATQPWWLRDPRRGALYDAPVTGVSDDEIERRDWAQVKVAIDGLPLPARLAVPMLFRSSEGVIGDRYSQLFAAPGLTVTPARDRGFVRAGTDLARDVNVVLRSNFAGQRTITVRVRGPSPMSVEPRAQEVVLAGGESRTLTFRLGGLLPAGEHVVALEAETGGQIFGQAVQLVDYGHVTPQRMYRPAEIRLTAVEVEVPAGLTVGYVPGMADPAPEVLRGLGISVMTIAPGDLPAMDLDRFPVIAVGPRAYEAHPELLEHNQRLLDYAAGGGRLVVQYGQVLMGRPGILPYPVTITRPVLRVTDETAPVTFTDPAARELRYPNRITSADFEGWVQERSTFMPGTYDQRYRTILAMSDPGESPQHGSLLIAPVGRGTYIYTTLVLFRQLAEGVPGAARILVNLLAPGHEP